MGSEREYVGPPLVGADPSWQIRSLESICDGVFDCPHSTPKLVEKGIYMVRTQDIRKGYFDTTNSVFVSQETYEKRIQRAEPTFGDILFSREGTYFGDAAEIPLGTKVCLGQRMALIRPKAEIIKPSFLRIWINPANFQNYLLAFRDGTVAERLNMSTVRTLPIPLPPLPEQKAIAHILGTLDDKIELRDLRNRVFHHEHILHWGDLDQRHQAISEIIEWMSPELPELNNPIETAKLKQVMPSNQTIAELGLHLREFHTRMFANTAQSQTLTKLRDTLLPKLISGELRIPEAEQLTKEALA